MLRFLLQALLICIVFIAAWRGGGKPERYVASIYFSMLLASTANVLWGEGDDDAAYLDVHYLRFALDFAAFAGVLFIALRYDRWWTLWVGSVQFIALMAHVLRAFDLPMPPIAYAVMERWPIWIAVIITGMGTFLHHKRRKAIHTIT